VQSFVDNDCWSESYPDLQAVGNTPDDFFSSTYQSAISIAAIPILGDGNCSGNALCTTWINRMIADWPHLTGGAAQVPILIYYANNDTTIPPDFAQCVFNRLTSDKVDYQVCYDTNPVGHGGVVAENASNVVDWIASKTSADGGAPNLTHCTTLPASDAGVPLLSTPDGGVQTCYDLLSTF
jgi:hypothetical protein